MIQGAMAQVIYGKFKQKGKSILEGERSITKRNLEGLGIIPKKVLYVDSILMHGSRINPYKHYTWENDFV